MNEGGPMNATVTVKLSAQAFGFYANEIALGIDCSETIATEVEPGMNTFMLQINVNIH